MNFGVNFPLRAATQMKLKISDANSSVNALSVQPGV